LSGSEVGHRRLDEQPAGILLPGIGSASFLVAAAAAADDALSAEFLGFASASVAAIELRCRAERALINAPIGKQTFPVLFHEMRFVWVSVSRKNWDGGGERHKTPSCGGGDSTPAIEHV